MGSSTSKMTSGFRMFVWLKHLGLLVALLLVSCSKSSTVHMAGGMIELADQGKMKFPNVVEFRFGGANWVANKNSTGGSEGRVRYDLTVYGLVDAYRDKIDDRIRFSEPPDLALKRFMRSLADKGVNVEIDGIISARIGSNQVK